MFSQLENTKPRWQSFAASYAIQIVAMSLLVLATVMTPQIIEHHYGEHVELVAPPLFQPEPYKPPKVIRITPKIIQPPKEELAKFAPAVPKIVVPKDVVRKTEVADVAAPKVPMPGPKFDSPVLDKMPGPKVVKAVVTNVFGSSATPTLPANTPSAKVQTGGFGDPNGVAPNPNARDGKLVMAAGGSFELPTGPGTGNGTGGARGAKGTIASAGFGNGIATGDGGGGRGYGGGGRVQTTAFTQQAPVAEAPKRRMEDVTPITPVSITSKPSPSYTDEARKLRVEGEVLVRVVFTANGEVRVVGVIRGLGHGLDESAIQAAQKVRFQPAQKNGQPVDSQATLHIVFQLS